MTHSKDYLLYLILPVAVILQSCGSTTDTVVVVRDAPRVEQTQEDTTETETEEFMQLNIGLIDPVTNFDPLFAGNLSTQRVVSLLYQGLLTLDKNGEPVPAIANETYISDDGLVYTFSINRDLFYHDSPAFTAGIGRRIHAADVKWAFERTARRDFPEHAANLLMGIRGYENYYLEQRTVYDSDHRVLDGVNGIRVENAETVVIELMQPDPDFLKKIASPFLLIYPREAVLNSDEGLKRRPVGTGPYRLNRVEENGTIVLSRADREQNGIQANLPRVNRIDLIKTESEGELFQRFARGEIDWIPELGPEITRQVVTENHTIQSAYADQYSLASHNTSRNLYFFLHDRSTVDHEWLKSRLALLTNEDFTNIGNASLNIEEFEINDDSEPESEYYLTLSDDYFVRTVYTLLHSLVLQPESALVFFDIRVPTYNTSFYSSTADNIHHGWQTDPGGYWLRVDRKILSLYYEHVTGIEPTNVPWQLHIRDIRVQNRD